MKPDTGLVQPLTTRGFKPVARLRPRTAKDVGSSPWTIGSETLDRDYVDFAQTGPHLGELGATHVRLQAGWAKCEPNADGRYDWAWLDAIIDACVRQGVRPWLQTSYGNPNYPGGGGIGLAQGIPTSPAALAAWDRWVGAMAERYQQHVGEWEIWNEPDIHDAVAPSAYVDFFIRTATILRRVRPDARVAGLALAGSMPFAEQFLAGLAAAGRASLLDEVSYHFYPHNPDDAFDAVDALRALVARHAPHATLRQGETGAPSETVPFMALGKFEWTERKQAAWDLRRLLAHHVRGIPMSLFQLADMQYHKGSGAKFEGRNSKGLLCIDADKTVAYRKPSYFMAQHVFGLLDDPFPLRPLENLAANEATRTHAHAWTRRDEKVPCLVAWWRADEPPALGEPPVDHLALPKIAFREPVLFDFMSGVVFDLPAGATDAAWRELPRADVPLAMAERGVLHLRDLEGV